MNPPRRGFAGWEGGYLKALLRLGTFKYDRGMSDNKNMISEEAVEAAAKAIDASKSEGCGCCAYPEFTAEDDNRADELDINVRALLIAREALEAAAPHMLRAAKAEAWDEGNIAGIFDLPSEKYATTNPYRSQA